MSKRLKVLISAYACDPTRGSEPGVGWNWVRQLSRSHDLWVVTRSKNREVIEHHRAALDGNVHFIYFDLPPWSRRWKRGRRGIHLYYFLWQVGIYPLCRRLHRRVGFDLAHHVTCVNYWMPTLLPLLPAPLIWSAAGGEAAPKEFWLSFGAQGKCLDLLRDAAQNLMHCNPLLHLVTRRTALSLVTTPQTEERVRGLGGRRTLLFPQAALDDEDCRRLSRPKAAPGKPLRVVSLGGLGHWKGFEFGVRAFARLHRLRPECEYWLIGDGPERQRLERLAARLGVGRHVTFWGDVPRQQALEKLTECDLLLYPSLHDSGSWACIEAMAAGLPVVCLDLGGPALHVDAQTGFKIAARSPRQVVDDLSAALLRMADDPAARSRVGQAAAAAARERFTWDAKGTAMRRIYADLLAETAESVA